MDARLHVASRTSTQVHCPEAILLTTVEAVDSVISSSCVVKSPDVWGKSWTSSKEGSGRRSGGMIHSFGILDVRSACFAEATFFHDGSVILIFLMLSFALYMFRE